MGKNEKKKKNMSKIPVYNYIVPKKILPAGKTNYITLRWRKGHLSLMKKERKKESNTVSHTVTIIIFHQMLLECLGIVKARKKECLGPI